MTKPPNAGKGRPKGSKNKNTAAVKEMVLAALGGVGGVEYLKRQANENPAAFLTLVGKIIPTQIEGELAVVREFVSQPTTPEEWEAQHAPYGASPAVN